MLNKIIGFSIHNKLIIGLFVCFLVGFGIYQVTRLPIDAVPDITDNQVQVITVAPALGAPDVERLITFPIEQTSSNIPGLKEIRSFSRFGLSVVTIVFTDDVDVYWARQQVNERLLQAQEQIPKEFGTPRMAPVTTGLGEIYQYTLRPRKGYEHKFNPMQLRTIQDWLVRRQLLGVAGVAEVASFGGLLKQYEIAVDPARLQAAGVTINEVFTSLEKNNQNTGGAYIEKGPTVLFIRTEGLVGAMDDIRNIVVKNTQEGLPVLIRDVATVQLGSATRYGAMTYNGEYEVSGAVVMMLKGANSNEVIENIKTRIEKIQKTLPEGVVIDPFLDRTKMVNNAIDTVTTNLLEGALIVIFVLVIFLGNLRAGLLVASVIPLAMLFAIILMNIFGVSGNLMSLGALDFGLIVDGAVIIVEAVMHNLARRSPVPGLRLNQDEMDTEVKRSASRMMNAAIFGQVIILVVYLPIFTLKGIEGKMFLPMAQTVVFALLGAFILSVTYVPMMSALVLRKQAGGVNGWSDRLMKRIANAYRKALTRAFGYQRAILAGTVVLFTLAIVILTRIGGEFIPSLPEGDFAIETRVLPGSNLNTSIQAASQAAKILRAKFPEVQEVVTKTGSSEIPTDPMPLEASDVMVILKPRSEWTSASTYNELIDQMSAALEAVPGVTFGFQYPVAMRFNELMTGARQDVVCKIFGENLDTLAYFARQVGEISGTIEGVKDLYVEAVTGMPQVIIQYDRVAIARYGLNIADINRSVNIAFAGQAAGEVYEQEKRFDLVVRLDAAKRRSLADVQELLIVTPQGNQVPLRAVARVEAIEGPNQIQREDAQRRIIVGLNVRDRDVQSVVAELQEKITQKIKLPVGYHMAYGGAFENLEAARQRLSVAVPVALLLIFIMLYFAFHSLKHGLLIYSAIPLSAIGGILALALRGMPFSISAGVGFIALFGVSVLNGIVLVAEFNRLKKESDMDLGQIILEGTASRLRPVLMTAFVASLGFLPMAVSQGEGAEVQRPLATVVIGGLLLATLLTLFVLPILYKLFEKKNVHPPKIAAALAGMLLFAGASAFGQQQLSLQAAIDTALKNNLSVKNEKLNSEMLHQRKGTAYAIPQTTAQFDYGQLNSSYYDNRMSIQQSMKFPSVYSAQKKVLNAEWENSLLSLTLQQSEIRKQVTTLFYDIGYLHEKQKLLLFSDSLFASFLEHAELRLAKGETNILEKAAAESQRNQISIQLQELNHDLGAALVKFNRLLNGRGSFVPGPAGGTMAAPLLADTSAVRLHPLARQWQQAVGIQSARLKLERTRILPDLFASYSSTTIRGLGADNIFYTGANRFQAFSLGIGLPLFFGAQAAGVKAARAEERLAQNRYEEALLSLNMRYQEAVLAYQKNLATVNVYESSALKNAETVLAAAGQLLNKGSVNYLEWVMLVHNAIGMKSGYLDARRNLNQSITELNYFNTK